MQSFHSSFNEVDHYQQLRQGHASSLIRYRLVRLQKRRFGRRSHSQTQRVFHRASLYLPCRGKTWCLITIEDKCTDGKFVSKYFRFKKLVRISFLRSLDNLPDCHLYSDLCFVEEKGSSVGKRRRILK